jgi:hypothetical protein
MQTVEDPSSCRLANKGLIYRQISSLLPIAAREPTTVVHVTDSGMYRPACNLI